LLSFGLIPTKAGLLAFAFSPDKTKSIFRRMRPLAGASDIIRDPIAKDTCMIRIALFALCVTVWPCSRSVAQEKSFDSNGVKIHYVVEGEGEPVLLIHGFTANAQVQWGLPGIIKALAKDYQVIALDNRGHGKSDKPHDPRKYGMEMVEDSIRLLDHLQIKKAHVVGDSMGAMLTCKLATTYPDRVISATLGGAAGLRAGADFSFFERLADSLDSGKGIGPLIEALHPPGKPKPTEEQIKAFNSMLSVMNDTKALGAVVRSWKDVTVPDDKLKSNKVPTLAIIGEIDPLKRGVDELKETMANLDVVVIEGADHMNAFTRPEFVKSLQAFLAKHAVKPKARATAK
jgi:pimeloyl-ACP methyl ester carboxylesterase